MELVVVVRQVDLSSAALERELMSDVARADGGVLSSLQKHFKAYSSYIFNDSVVVLCSVIVSDLKRRKKKTTTPFSNNIRVNERC